MALSRIIPKAWRERYDRIPASLKAFIFVVWVGWKFVALGIVWYLSREKNTSNSSGGSKLRVLLLITAPHRTEAFTSSITNTIVNLEHQFDVFVNWIVDDANDEYAFWSDATPIYGSLYRQERFVLKDAILSYDLFVALYDEHVVLTQEMVIDYVETSRKLLADHNSTNIEYLPLIADIGNEGANQQMEIFEHPQLGAAGIINLPLDGNQHRWGWMITREQAIQLYKQEKFHLPPFDDAIAGKDDHLYVDIASDYVSDVS